MHLYTYILLDIKYTTARVLLSVPKVCSVCPASVSGLGFITLLCLRRSSRKHQRCRTLLYLRDHCRETAHIPRRRRRRTMGWWTQMMKMSKMQKCLALRDRRPRTHELPAKDVKRKTSMRF